MFCLIKKVMVLALISVSSALTSQNCLLLNDQKWEVKKVVIDNDYMTFPFKIRVDKYV